MVDIRLYALLDASLGRERLPEMAQKAADGGATLIQYRDKTGGTRDMVNCATAIREALAGRGIPFLVNDRIDVALASGAAGVHLGREDMEAETARAILGDEAIIGLTVKNSRDAEIAGLAPIDYACIGGVFETLSKDNPDSPLGIEGLSDLRRYLCDLKPSMPVGAIAGIDVARTAAVISAGADGIAVISAIFKDADPVSAARTLRNEVDKALVRRT